MKAFLTLAALCLSLCCSSQNISFLDVELANRPGKRERISTQRTRSALTDELKDFSRHVTIATTNCGSNAYTYLMGQYYEGHIDPEATVQVKTKSRGIITYKAAAYFTRLRDLCCGRRAVYDSLRITFPNPEQYEPHTTDNGRTYTLLVLQQFTTYKNERSTGDITLKRFTFAYYQEKGYRKFRITTIEVEQRES